MDKNRADVTICGQSYVLASEKSEERIKEVAKYVDEELRRTSRQLNVNPNFKSAILTALNIAETLMDTTDKLLQAQIKVQQLDTDVRHYVSKWEESKKQVGELRDKMTSDFDRQIQNTEDQRKLRAKLTEVENAYYDLQKENVSLKNTLKSLNRTNNQDEF